MNFSIVGTFLIALLFTSREEPEFSSLQKLVEKYRWTLRIHARSSSGLTDLALYRLDTLLSSTVPAPSSRGYNGMATQDPPVATGFAHESPRGPESLPRISPLASGTDVFGELLIGTDINEADVAAAMDFDFERWMRDPGLFGMEGLLNADTGGMDLDFPAELAQFDQGPGF